MKTSVNVLSGFVQRWALGILLGFSVSLCAIPERAEAKGNTVEKTTSGKKADKKISSKKRSAKKASFRKAVKGDKKTSRKKSSGKSASKAKSAKSSKVAKKSGKAKRANKSTKKATRRQQRQDQYVWIPSSEPKQAYYIMPTVSGAASKSVQAAQPVAFPAAPPQQQQADNKAKAYQVGTASYYGNAFNGKKTASGERFDQNDLTCAHGSLPFGCKIRVTNLRNKKSVEVKVNDRGGFQKHGRVIDLSKAAAKEIGMLNTGTAKVQIEVLE